MLITRNYTNFAGVDFSNGKVGLNRSPDSVNMYKDYSSTQGQCIESRPGYIKIGTVGTKINGIYFFEYNNSVICVVHSGTKLYKWTNFPNTPEELTELFSSMNNAKTSFLVFDSKLYINDGANYLVYNGTTCASVTGYVPTTSISRTPLGGGEIYQAVNLIQPKRKNTFLGDGTSTIYYLDATSITSVETVKVNGVLKTPTIDYTVSTINGTVTFVTAPPSPSTPGQDNVEIEFSKTVSGYEDRIKKSTISIEFDRRLFFSGNPDFPNALFHSELNDPTYISDLAYYQDGEETSSIKSITVGNNLLWVFKESNQQNATIFYHTPTLDYDYGKVYPSKQGNISTGCYSTSINFNDDIVFMSKYGLEGINSTIEKEQVLAHRSSLVDSKMINDTNFNECEMQEWKGYLMCMINGHIYLADSRQRFAGINGTFEYEWYYWDNIKIGSSLGRILKEYRGNLYFGCADGSIAKFTGTNDNTGILTAYWTTPFDNFGQENHLKTTNKRGGVVKIKTIPNSTIKIAEKTNKTQEKNIGQWSATGFDYGNFDYGNFSYATEQNSRVIYKIKEKKFIDISIKFYSDAIDKPFGIYEATLEAFVGGYVK